MKQFICAIASVCLLSNITSAQYCTPTVTLSDFYISEISVGVYTNTTGNDTYSDYSPTDTIFVNQVSTPLTFGVVTAAYNVDRFVFIDWSNNYVFDDTAWSIETIAYPTSIDIPLGISAGSYRMRFVVGDHNDHHMTPFPCIINDGEVEDYTLTVLPFVGIDDISLNPNLILYPNPTSNVLNIDSDFIFESIQLYNVTGQLIDSFNSETTSIDTAVLPSGIYYMKFSSSDMIIVKKFVNE